MAELNKRLAHCFSAVFPALSAEQITQAQPSTVAGWDSVASVSLFATVEEEFGIEIDIPDMKNLLSFEQLLDYLQKRSIPELREGHA